MFKKQKFLIRETASFAVTTLGRDRFRELINAFVNSNGLILLAQLAVTISREVAVDATRLLFGFFYFESLIFFACLPVGRDFGFRASSFEITSVPELQSPATSGIP